MKTIKRILILLLALFLLTGIYICIPGIWSSLNPGKPPLGYYSIIPTYLAIWTGLEKMAVRNPEIPGSVKEIKNVEYKNADGKSLQIDFFIPENQNKPLPLLLFIHGGGWKGGKRSDYLVYLIAFAKKGYATATVSYRLVKDAPYPACAEDITDAIRWLSENGDVYGIDPDRIALIGGSAGAHLALLGAYGWNKPGKGNDANAFTGPCNSIKAVVDIYGPADLTTKYARNHPLVKNFMARSWEEAPELYRQASPITYLDKSDPPTLILHGTSDRLVPVSQSDNLKTKLDSLGIPSTYHRLPGWPHAMDQSKRVNDYCQSAIHDFLIQHLGH